MKEINIPALPIVACVYFVLVSGSATFLELNANMKFTQGCCFYLTCRDNFDECKMCTYVVSFWGNCAQLGKDAVEKLYEVVLQHHVHSWNWIKHEVDQSDETLESIICVAKMEHKLSVAGSVHMGKNVWVSALHVNIKKEGFQLYLYIHKPVRYHFLPGEGGFEYLWSAQWLKSSQMCWFYTIFPNLQRGVSPKTPPGIWLSTQINASQFPPSSDPSHKDYMLKSGSASYLPN